MQSACQEIIALMMWIVLLFHINYEQPIAMI